LPIFLKVRKKISYTSKHDQTLGNGESNYFILLSVR